MPPRYRRAVPDDVPDLMEIRFAVRENVLSNLALVTPEIVADYLVRRGCGWICEEDGRALGFAIADASPATIWALFLRPEAEGRGIGRELLRLAVDWLFAGGATAITLSTTPGTRADRFYAAQGWVRGAVDAHGDVGFTLRRPTSAP